MVAQLLDKHSVPEVTQEDDYGDIVEDLNLNDDLPSPYEFRKTVKAMRATIRYSVGIHNTVNK